MASNRSQLVVPSQPDTQPCYWCGEPSKYAYQPNRKGAAIFNYVCEDHAGHAQRAGWRECIPGVGHLGYKR